MVDEAHSSGVIGPHGGGVDDHFGLAPDDIDIKMGTLSKALGTCGGLYCGKKMHYRLFEIQLIRFCLYGGNQSAVGGRRKARHRAFAGGQLHCPAAAQNIAFFIEGAQALGLNTINAKESAIVPIFIGTDRMAFQASHAAGKGRVCAAGGLSGCGAGEQQASLFHHIRAYGKAAEKSPFRVGRGGAGAAADQIKTFCTRPPASEESGGLFCAQEGLQARKDYAISKRHIRTNHTVVQSVFR